MDGETQYIFSYIDPQRHPNEYALGMLPLLHDYYGENIITHYTQYIRWSYF